MNPLQCLQNVLDNYLYPEGVFTYWQNKAESDNSDEYFVYTLNGEEATVVGDNEVTQSETYITLRYFYRRHLLDDYKNTKKEQNRIFSVIDELRKHKFVIPDGPFDIGIIDDKSLKETDYNITLIELVYQRIL